MQKYLKVSPRGFSNEVNYYRVPADKITEAETEYGMLADQGEGYAEWTSDKIASKPGVAIEWADRHW